MIDLSTWNLSIPVGTPATTIATPQLVGGYQDDYFKAANGAIFFWAPVNGTTTKSAKYPRSELRETYADGTLRNWKYQDADNTLDGTLKVSQVPSTGKIVIGQIHDVESSNPPIKLQYQYKAETNVGSIVAIVRVKPTDDSTSYTVAQNVPLEQLFSYTIRLTPSGTLAIYVKPSASAATVKWTAKLDTAWKTSTFYFKAGSYVQDNTGDSSEAGAVSFTSLTIKHK
ncbi:polysaccharide lyase family 7 protein [Pseudomonas sp. LRF_L74]|uniref:polysaccharide lyase family 7 protein n=1 Tax=Pseudomonas sp. LRF_L74 TaxID=3369422 RepID=UPI003F5D8D5A